MPPLLPNNLEKMNHDMLCSYLSQILKQELKKTGQTGKGTGLQFRWGDHRLTIRWWDDSVWRWNCASNPKHLNKDTFNGKGEISEALRHQIRMYFEYYNRDPSDWVTPKQKQLNHDRNQRGRTLSTRRSLTRSRSPSRMSSTQSRSRSPRQRQSRSRSPRQRQRQRQSRSRSRSPRRRQRQSRSRSRSPRKRQRQSRSPRQRQSRSRSRSPRKRTSRSRSPSTSSVQRQSKSRSQSQSLLDQSLPHINSSSSSSSSSSLNRSIPPARYKVSSPKTYQGTRSGKNNP